MEVMLATARGGGPQRRPRRNQPLPAEDAALAVFRDIVEGHQQPNHARQHSKPGKSAKYPKTDEEENEELDGQGLQLSQDEIRELQRQHQEEQDKNQEHEHENDQPSAGRDSAATKELYNHLIKLAQLRSQPETSPATLFQFFDTSMYPHMIDHSSRRLPNIFRQAAQQIVREVSEAKQRDYRATDLPTVARITQIRRQLDLLNVPASWAPLVLGLTSDIVATREKDDSTQAVLVQDLIEAWRMFSLPDLVVADQEALEKAPSTEFRMPTPDAALVKKYAQRRNIQRGLACLFPRYAPPQMKQLTPALLATYAVLTDASITSAEDTEKAREFLNSVTNILAISNASRQAAADMFKDRPELGAYVLSRWPLAGGSQGEGGVVAEMSAATAAADSTTITAPTEARASKDARRATLDIIHKQLLQALRARNLQECEAVWERFWAAVSQPDVEGAKALRNSAEIFDTFIMAFTMMRMPDRAIAVWNVMTTVAGIEPTLRTWTSFMVGYKRTSNPAGIHTIWAKLVASGIKLDKAVWTARISGLIESGDAAAGMQALEEMQQQWEEWAEAQKVKSTVKQTEAQKGGQKTTGAEISSSGGSPASTVKPIKPSIEPVNAAIAGLLRKGDLVAAKKVLAWAGHHGIEPDIITFNTILRPLVRDGAGDEVAGVLNIMRQRGIYPDEATITILLDGTFGNGAMSGRSAEEQAEAVKNLLAEIEASGLDANLQTYAKIIYLLLEADTGSSSGYNASTAVSIVLKRMRQRGIAASAHIYTILAEHYFACNPPDLEAVRSLIETGDPGVASSSSSSSSSAADASSSSSTFPLAFDRVFWERVVRGFAQVGDTASAQRYFVNIADSLSVTSSTLEDLLRALISNNEWAAAAALVAKVQAQKTLWVQGGNGEATTTARPRAVDSRQFRHRFWHLAAEHGLLQLEQPR
ncbi:hypothetical protein SBRCBS47491_004169 [Sporothrix bragantina]|uniref:Pentatricopeptide repeat protein n=1 Tax=Sporothrix bragantina TaxID=671064 RepID=A0ABP0BMD4_9PEZI